MFVCLLCAMCCCGFVMLLCYVDIVCDYYRVVLLCSGICYAGVVCCCAVIMLSLCSHVMLLWCDCC